MNINSNNDRKKVGFLFNHVAAHQVLHAAPIAFELSRQFPDIEVEIISSSEEIESVARKIGNLYPQHRVSFRRAYVPRLFKLLDPVVRNVRFISKDAVRVYNRPLLQTLDVLVTPEANSLKLREHPELADLRIIHTQHGAGDRVIGHHERKKNFDLVLCPGVKLRDRMIHDLGANPDRLAVTGYPKFEIVDKMTRSENIFENSKPIVLYNPHFSNTESSWRRHGRKVLEYFKNQADYNLIFAPHILLYKRALRHGSRFLGSYRGLPHIHIDTGSMASIDMTYTSMADIYLGDVSSQVYEFIRTPRPCIFIDNGADPNPDNRLYHTMGDVIGTVEDLPQALETAFSRHEEKYRSVQKELFLKTFDENGEYPSVRGAKAVKGFLDRI